MSLFRRIDDWLHPEITVPTRREVSEPPGPKGSSCEAGLGAIRKDALHGGSLTPSPDDAPVREIAGYVCNGEASVVTTRGVVIPIHTAPRDWTVAQLIWLLAEIDALPEVEP